MKNTTTRNLPHMNQNYATELTVTACWNTGETNAEADMHARWAPSPDQLDAAAFAFTTYPAEQRDDLTYIVPLALVGKVKGVWTTDVIVEALDGLACMAWTGPGDAPEFTGNYREGCDNMADYAHGLLHGRTGTPSYATIEADGTWAVWEANWPVGKPVTDLTAEALEFLAEHAPHLLVTKAEEILAEHAPHLLVTEPTPSGL